MTATRQLSLQRETLAELTTGSQPAHALGRAPTQDCEPATLLADGCAGETIAFWHSCITCICYP